MINPSRYIVVIPGSKGKYLFVNTFTGAALEGTEKIKRILKGSQSPRDCDEETVAELIATGFLTELTPQEEIEYMVEKVKSVQHLYREHTLFSLILTYECNMRCSYCFQSYLFEKDQAWLEQRMGFEQVDAAFEAMETLNPDTKIPIHLFGGEPLYYKNYDIVKYVLEKGTLHGKSFIVVTNGLEADKFIPLLIRSNVTSLQITVDGVEPVHDERRKKVDGTGTFQEIVANIELLEETGLPVYVKIVFDHSTVRALPELVTFFQEKGWGQHNYNQNKNEKNKGNVHYFLTPAGHHTKGGCFNFLCTIQEEDMHFLLEEPQLQKAFWQGLAPLRKKLGLGVENWLPSISYCRHNPSQLWFDPFGDLFVCTDSLGDPEHKVGTYYPGLSFNEQYSSWKKRTVFYMDSCHLCKYALICGGGCGHYTYHEKGRLLHPDCTFLKQAISVYYPLLWKMIKKLY